MSNTMNGAKYLLQGFRLLKEPDVRLLVVLPLVLNLAIFAAVTWYAIIQFGTFMDWMLDYVPQWLDLIAWLIWLLFGLLLAIVYGYSFAILGNILGSPFYGLLSERVQRILTGGERSETFDLKIALNLAWRSFQRELLKLGYFLPRILLVSAIALAASFIPVINLMSPILVMAWGAWSMALQYYDYPADNNGVAFPEMKDRVSQSRLTSLVFGGAVMAGSSIPLVNLLVMPAAVAGATAFWIDRMEGNQ